MWKILLSVLATGGLAAGALAYSPGRDAGSRARKPVLAMKEWEQDVRKRMDKDDTLKKLAAKYPLVLLHSRQIFCPGDTMRSAFSFINGTSDPNVHLNDIQLMFHNSYDNRTFQVVGFGGHQNLIVDLGKVDFERNPDPARINIEHPGLHFDQLPASEGSVYLERVRDKRGNHFYVLLQMVAVDKESRYIAFIWRMLPGGKVVRKRDPNLGRQDTSPAPSLFVSFQETPVPQRKEWEQNVRKRIDLDKRLKALAAKHPLVMLHSYQIYFDIGYNQSAFSFIYETSDSPKNWNDVQLLFHGRAERTMGINPQGGQKNFVVDLGKEDFEKNPDPTQISIDHPGLTGAHVTAAEGHVYLERVRDQRGNNFYVLFEVVAVDGEGRYMAFLWRKLPGGKVVKRPEKK
jgi:hypothetical protein